MSKDREDFYKKNSIDGGFLQSEYWEKFQQKLGRKTYRFCNEELTLLAIQHQLPWVGGYFFVPRGPILNSEIKLYKAQIFLRKLIENAQKEKIGWIRIEPQKEADLALIKKALAGEYKIIKAKKDHQPKQTIFLDLQKSEKEILSEMKPKTRYNIALAQRKNIKIYQSQDPAAVEAFLDLTEETAKRDGITVHPQEYYVKMIQTINKEQLCLYLAEYNGKNIAAALVCAYGSVATYLHGASADEFRNKMGPYLLHWRIIQELRQKGIKKYDWGGVKIGTDKKSRKWAGITRFKSGFDKNTKITEFVGCWDIVLDTKKYWLYRIIQIIKSLHF